MKHYMKVLHVNCVCVCGGGGLDIMVHIRVPAFLQLNGKINSPPVFIFWPIKVDILLDFLAARS